MQDTQRQRLDEVILGVFHRKASVAELLPWGAVSALAAEACGILRESLCERRIPSDVAIFDVSRSSVTKARNRISPLHLDSLLAFVSANRFSRHEARTFGDPSEGIIHV